MKKKFYKALYVLVTVCLLSCMFKKALLVKAEEYQYDENGRVVSVKHDDGSVTEYEYDKNGNIISIKTKAGNNKPAGEEQKPTGEEDKPTGEEDKPTGEEDKPAGEEQKPTGEEDKPTGEEQKSSGEEKKPTGKEDKPAGEEDKPAGQKNGDSQTQTIVDNNNSKSENHDNPGLDNKYDQKNGNASANNSNDGVRTGDVTLLVPVGLLMLVSIVMVIVLIYKKKHNKNGEDK